MIIIDNDIVCVLYFILVLSLYYFRYSMCDLSTVS